MPTEVHFTEYEVTVKLDFQRLTRNCNRCPQGGHESLTVPHTQKSVTLGLIEGKVLRDQKCFQGIEQQFILMLYHIVFKLNEPSSSPCADIIEHTR